MSFFDKLRGAQEPEAKSLKKPAKKKIKVEPKTELKPVEEQPEQKSEGQLALDVYETNGDFVIQSTIAGVKAEDLDISVEDGMVTIKGERQKQKEGEEEGKEGKYYYQECYWGAFSRQVILPEEVDGSKAEATIKDGVLTLKIPKIHKVKKKKITVREEI